MICPSCQAPIAAHTAIRWPTSARETVEDLRTLIRHKALTGLMTPRELEVIEDVLREYVGRFT